MNAGIVFYWITFPITDVIGEVYGRKKPLSLFGSVLSRAFNVGLDQVVVALHRTKAMDSSLLWEKTLSVVPVMDGHVVNGLFMCSNTRRYGIRFFVGHEGLRHLWLRNTYGVLTTDRLCCVQRFGFLPVAGSPPI